MNYLKSFVLCMGILQCVPLHSEDGTLSAETQERIDTSITSINQFLKLYNLYRFAHSLLETSSPARPGEIPVDIPALLNKFGYSPDDFQIYITNGVHNAFSLYLGKSKFLKQFNRITIGRPLLKLLSPEELEFVIAHEIGHAHYRTNYCLKFLLMFIAVDEAIDILKKCLNLWSPNIKKNYLSYIVFSYGTTILKAGIKEICFKALSRAQEEEVDIIAVVKTGKTSAGIDAFKKMQKAYTPKTFFQKLFARSEMFSSHPSFDKRIAYLTEFQENIPTEQY